MREYKEWEIRHGIHVEEAHQEARRRQVARDEVIERVCCTNG